MAFVFIYLILYLVPDRPSPPVYKLLSDEEPHYLTERVVVNEGSGLNVSCVSYSGLAEHRVPIITRGDGLTLSNRININQRPGETRMSITDITEREGGTYVCSVEDLNIGDSVSGKKLISCLVIGGKRIQ